MTPHLELILLGVLLIAQCVLGVLCVVRYFQVRNREKRLERIEESRPDSRVNLLHRKNKPDVAKLKSPVHPLHFGIFKKTAQFEICRLAFYVEL